jgi:3-dehydroquinate dehydratase-2
MKKILFIHGPNLNLLGKRQIKIYGSLSQTEIFGMLESIFSDYNFTFFQSNHEGKIIDQIHNANDSMDAIIINPGAFAHYSYAIRDAIESIETPTIEVHLSNILKREDFRKISVISDVCKYTIIGKGYDGYTEAVKKVEDLK